MVLVHNAGNDHRNWDAQVDHFKDRFTVYAIDMFGYGASDSPGPQSLDLHSNALADLFESLDLRDVTLVGHCVGGAASWHCASRHPERIRKLILFSPATEATMRSGMWGPLYWASRRSRWANKLAEVGVRAARKTDVGRRTTVLAMFGDDGPPDEFLAHSMALMERPDAIQTLNELLVGFSGFGILDRFERPEAFPPTLLLWGTRNRVLSIQSMAAVLDHLRPDRNEVFTGRGHLCMVEAPEQINAAMDRFLRAS